MINISDIKQQAKTIYSSGTRRFAGAECLSCIIKFAVLLLIVTSYIIFLTKYGSLAVTPLSVMILVAAYLVYYFFIAAPLNLGKKLFFTKVAECENPDTDSLFHFYKDLKTAIYTGFRTALATIFYTVLFTAITIVYFKIYFIFSSVWFSAVNIIACIAIILLYISMIVITKLKYSVVPIVYFRESELNCIPLISKSLRNSFGVKSELFLLHLSFAGWYLLGLITLGIGFIWIRPYIRIASSIYLTESVR